MGADLKVGSEDFYTENEGKIAENRALIDVNRRYFGSIADFLRLIDVNAGGLGLKKGQGILHLIN